MMSSIDIFFGVKFNRLVILSDAGLGKNYVRFVNAKCDCGATIKVRLWEVKKGKTKSCGCYRSDNYGKQSTTHGLTKSGLHPTWQGIKSRCYNHDHKDYPRYGGRGIKVCAEWLESYGEFAKWCLSQGWEKGKGLSIDRVDGSGDYEPANCRIATPLIQGRNRSSNTTITYQGQTRCLSEWADVLGINYHTIIARYHKWKWPVELVLSKHKFRKNDRRHCASVCG